MCGVAVSRVLGKIWSLSPYLAQSCPQFTGVPVPTVVVEVDVPHSLWHLNT